MNTYEVTVPFGDTETINADSIAMLEGNLIFGCKEKVVAAYNKDNWDKVIMTSEKIECVKS